MGMLARIRLGQRLALGFGLVLSLLVALAALSLMRIHDLADTLDLVAVRGAERSQALVRMERAAVRYSLALRDIPAAELEQAAATVSYTHLDVYKRQRLILGGDVAESPHPQRGPVRQCGLAAPEQDAAIAQTHTALVAPVVGDDVADAHQFGLGVGEQRRSRHQDLCRRQCRLAACLLYTSRCV